MDVFFNECSLHGQFQDIDSFVVAIDKLMTMRQVAKRYSRELPCYRNFQQTRATQKLTLLQAISQMHIDKARALRVWLAKAGPYWDDNRQHSPDNYYQCQNEVVTDTAIGECAYLLHNNHRVCITSITPSNWESPELIVDWHVNDDEVSSIHISNYINADTLQAVLQDAAPPIQSWAQLAEECRQRFDNLNFSDTSFDPLKGCPFVSSAAKSFLELIGVLSVFKSEHIEGSDRTQKGHDLYQTYFTGPFPWFTDSSDPEKNKFKKEITFPHPDKPGEEIIASFHGKVRTPQMRVHFSWPVRADEPLYILYVGNKITKI